MIAADTASTEHCSMSRTHLQKTFPIDQVRSRFPALTRTDDGLRRIYLDNPAGTQVPKRVVEAISHALIETNANLDGFFVTSQAAGKVVDTAREAMACFLGADDPDEIVIGQSMTALTFHASRSLCRDLEPGDEIIVTRMDHEGNVSPWLEVASDLGLRIRWVGFDPVTWRIEPEMLRAVLSERTKVLALNYASNLTGVANDVPGLTAVAKEVDALVYVDAVQFAPHRMIDVAELGCDFLVCSPYKFFGPHLGVLWGRRTLLESMHAYKCRCVSDKIPGRFELGTPAIELLPGLTAAVDHYAWLGELVGGFPDRRQAIREAYQAISSYESQLAAQLLEGLQSIPGIEIFGPTTGDSDERAPTVSFRHRAISPSHIAKRLGEQNIFVWSGHNYALETVRQLKIPEDEGVVRVGAVHYNTAQEIAEAVEAIEAATNC